MTTVKSLDDLKRIRQEALQKREAKTATGRARVIVGMGTCGIAAGARETMMSILAQIEQENLSGVVVTQTGCIGKCEYEPIVEVAVGDEPLVTYGHVTPERARQILNEHVGQGHKVTQFVIPA